MITTPDLPQVVLSRDQRIRQVVVGVLVALMLGRVVPDVVRVMYPLHYFGYVTNGDGVVVEVNRRLTQSPAQARKNASRDPVDPLLVGDRVRVDRIKPYDRKPGITGEGFSYDNPDRRLPIERDGKERIVHLVGHVESATLRFIEGRSHPEIAEILNQPIGTVKSHVHRAVRILRRILGPQVGRIASEDRDGVRPDGLQKEPANAVL